MTPAARYHVIPMPRLFRRETFIALRARRQAHAIARDVLNPHLDVSAVPCRACGGDVRIDPHHLGATATCPACGATVLLPANSLAETDDDAPPTINPRHLYYQRKPLPPRRELSVFQCFAVAGLFAIAFFTLVLLALTFWGG